MKNKNALILLLLLPIQSMQALSLSKALGKFLKCSWHITKIGGGLGCWSASPLAFGSMILFNKLPDAPPLGNMNTNDLRIMGYDAIPTLNQIGAQLVPTIDNSIANNPNITPEQRQQWQEFKRTGITSEHIDSAAEWYNNNRESIQDGVIATNRARTRMCTMSFLYFVGFLSAGSASIWSGIKGLCEELNDRQDPESDLSNFQFAE